MTFSSRYQRVSANLVAPANAAPFAYSDGPVEEYIAEVVANAHDCSVLSVELMRGIRDWPSLYHLSYCRSFLLRPLHRLLQGRTVLELGAGCGALTRYLGETASRVTALEGSPRRAVISASRCRDLANVTIVNDTIQDLELDEKFDVVTLIGVLEYARTFGPKVKKPEAALLAAASSFLKPGGHLLLAIENQLGLKYFAGAREDHVGMPFFGIHDLYNASTPVTFGRKELISLLRDAGYATIEQLVPLPDYKLPTTILYPACFDGETPSLDVTPFIQNSYKEDNQKASEFCFSLEAATGVIARNGLVQDLCNSLFFVASPQPDNPACDAARCVAHYGVLRAPEYAKETLFVRENGELRVRREYLAPALLRRKDGMVDNVLQSEPYLPYPLYHDSLIPIINRPGWTIRSIAVWARGWVNFLRSKASNDHLPGTYLDATPLNCAVTPDGEYVLFDQEWMIRTQRMIPLHYIVFRSLLQSLAGVENVAPPAERTPTRVVALITAVMNLLGVPLEAGMLDDCLRLEQEFQNQASLRRPSKMIFATHQLKIRPRA